MRVKYYVFDETHRSRHDHGQGKKPLIFEK